MLEIKEISIEEFEKELIDDYKTLFPRDEQRDWKNVQRTYKDGIEKFSAIVNDSQTIGFIMLEKLENAPYYMDYFAIKKEYQNQGYGTETLKVLLNDIIKENGVCIEIEKENNENSQTVRRATFYKTLNFKEVKSIYDLYKVLYTPYYWNSSKDYTKEEIDEIMFKYYNINCGEEQVKKNCRICD